MTSRGRSQGSRRDSSARHMPGRRSTRAGASRPSLRPSRRSPFPPLYRPAALQDLHVAIGRQCEDRGFVSTAYHTRTCTPELMACRGHTHIWSTEPDRTPQRRGLARTRRLWAGYHHRSWHRRATVRLPFRQERGTWVFAPFFPPRPDRHEDGNPRAGCPGARRCLSSILHRGSTTRAVSALRSLGYPHWTDEACSLS